jgi:heat-inducible transcriptional repressor
MSLDERKKKILGAVVRDYVDTVRPVGSEDLASRHAWGVKSATIRNELAELSDLGYLRQPHTSAGRIPSDRGYRFYVDHLMVAHEVVRDNSTSVGNNVSLELDFLLRQTCALLTRMTSYTSVATPPRSADTNVSQIFLSPAGESRLLLVILLSTGQVVNHLVPDVTELSGTDVISLSQALNATYSGTTLDAITDVDFPAPAAPAEFSPCLRATYGKLEQAIRHSAHQAADEDTVYMEGASEIIRQPEFRDSAKLDDLLETLQKRTLLFQTLSRALLGPNVAVVIGSENHVATMQECSVVTASYYIGTRERGTIGVVGPTRMDYDRAVPAVSFFARTLTQTLSRHTSR